MLEALGIKPIPMFMLSSWIKAAAKCGFNVQPLFKEAGITIDLIRLEEARVSPLQLVSVLEQCVAMSPNKYFPLVLGDTFAFESLPEFETLLTTSPTLRDAINVAKMARKVVLPWITIDLTEVGDRGLVTMGFDVPIPNLEAFGLPLHLVSHAIMACVRKFGRSLQGSDQGILEVHLKAASDSPFADQFEPFFGVPVKFGQAHDALVFERTILDQPLEGAFPALHEQAQFLAEQRLDKEVRRQGIAAEIEELISREPSLLALGIEDMAERLNLHARTLQRRLKEEGGTYLLVQARMRHRLACQWLRQGNVPIDDISARLGFSDRRAFTAAFKRWEGTTPKAWREQQG
ncbi:MAG TPA: AraC family transcriptional regulator ligand-binding domain-containing protein [Aquabacterium sp.]|uniref:helix-turn-helix domain-containing protein n=1 Tax=Aquabacterium sp. TaxID=1872578 RepID=UPI002E37DAC1|nr:AraC family transcriptional regulator ligand-binding domain-containing protein [Aquabacterium sp.]HEX5374241.1 AraC family transcriptional regulator ligand-binding domain-containing protein [Aquabacterium sp.]